MVPKRQNTTKFKSMQVSRAQILHIRTPPPPFLFKLSTIKCIIWANLATWGASRHANLVSLFSSMGSLVLSKFATFGVGFPTDRAAVWPFLCMWASVFCQWFSHCVALSTNVTAETSTQKAKQNKNPSASEKSCRNQGKTTLYLWTS